MSPDRIEYYYKKFKSQLTGFSVSIIYGFYSDDVVADSFLSLSKIEDMGEREVKKYLMNAVRHKCYNILKHNKRSMKHHSLIAKMSDDYIDALAIKSEVISAVAQALSDMPPKQREVFELKYFKGYESKEIADILGIKESTVNAHIFIAMKKVRADILS